MTESKLTKTMDIMCLNSNCTAYLHPVNIPYHEDISFYKCPRCDHSMEKYSANISESYQSKTNPQLKTYTKMNTQTNQESTLEKIKSSSKIYLKEKGFEGKRSDYSLLIIMTIILGPGTLILLSWLSKKLLGIYGISNFVNSIFNVDFFIFYIYLVLSTLASIIWWGYIIIEKLSKTK